VVFASIAAACAANPEPRPAQADPAPHAGHRGSSGPLIEGDVSDSDMPRKVRETYTKYEHRIVMRDGVRLFTSVYVPKDRSRKYPILFERTPYSVGPYGVDAYPRTLGPSTALFKSGYIFVYQDVRGRFQSEGEFVDVRPYVKDKRSAKDIDEASDAYDTIDWLVKNVPDNSGKVGVWGISYPGFYAAMAAVDAHPSLKAASPQAPVSDWFIGDDFHHNGALYLPHAFNFYSVFGKPRPAPTKKWPESFDYETTDGYDFSCDSARSPTPTASTSRGRSRSGTT
jgi:predicted acyl esterase